MDYRVEEIGAQAGVRVDTIRYYQTRGLLHPPRREGRVAIYDDTHLERLQRIRTLLKQRFTLAQIQRLSQQKAPPDAELLDALVEEQVGDRTFTLAELAAAAGIPEALIAAAASAGLVQPLRVEGEDRYTGADLEMARAGLELLNGGFPLQELLSLAVDHARHVASLADRAIDLFDDHVRKGPDGHADESSQVTARFRSLLPQVTRLVALHFQRTLVTRALERLSDRGADADLRRALAATGQASLEVQVAWR